MNKSLLLLSSLLLSGASLHARNEYRCWLHGINVSGYGVLAARYGQGKWYVVKDVANVATCRDLWTARGGSGGMGAYIVTQADVAAEAPGASVDSSSEIKSTATGCGNCGGDTLHCTGCTLK